MLKKADKVIPLASHGTARRYEFAASRFFSGLSREDIAKVLGKMEETLFLAGATIFSQGDQGDAFT